MQATSGNIELKFGKTCVTININMLNQVIKTKVLLIVVIAIISSFVFATAQVSAETPLDTMSDSCICNCGDHRMQTSMPDCCSMSESAFPDCGLHSIPEDGAILPGSSTPNLNIDNCQHTQIIPTGVDNDSKQFREQEPPQLLSPGLCSEYRCRSSLDSEDPYLN